MVTFTSIKDTTTTTLIRATTQGWPGQKMSLSTVPTLQGVIRGSLLGLIYKVIDSGKCIRLGAVAIAWS